MKQIKVSKATPIQLDWLVAKCESSDGRLIKLGGGWNGAFYIERENGPDSGGFHRFDPANDWAQGGPLVERERITLDLYESGEWLAQIWGDSITDSDFEECGPTPLIAVCRCYVASKMGDVVEVPEELG